jgi:hypothetical protein
MLDIIKCFEGGRGKQWWRKAQGRRDAPTHSNRTKGGGAQLDDEGGSAQVKDAGLLCTGGRQRDGGGVDRAG